MVERAAQATYKEMAMTFHAAGDFLPEEAKTKKTWEAFVMGAHHNEQTLLKRQQTLEIHVDSYEGKNYANFTKIATAFTQSPVTASYIQTSNRATGHIKFNATIVNTFTGGVLTDAFNWLDGEQVRKKRECD